MEKYQSLKTSTSSLAQDINSFRSSRTPTKPLSPYSFDPQTSVMDSLGTPEMTTLDGRECRTYESRIDSL